MSARLIQWVFFSVLIAILPIAMMPVRLSTIGTNIDFSLIVSHGELLLVSTAISGAAIGSLVASGEDRMSRKMIAGGCCVVIFFATALWFADISSTITAGGNIDSQFVSIGSATMFLLAVIASGSCIALGKK